MNQKKPRKVSSQTDSAGTKRKKKVKRKGAEQSIAENSENMILSCPTSKVKRSISDRAVCFAYGNGLPGRMGGRKRRLP